MERQRRAWCARSICAALGAGLAFATVSPLAHADLPARAYELVSQPDKGGYPVLWNDDSGIKFGLTKLTRDGATAMYSSYGAFAGVEGGMPQSYQATRGPAGWRSRTASPRTVAATPDTIFDYNNFWLLATPDLRTGYFMTRDPLDPAHPSGSRQLYTSTSDGTPTLVSLTDSGAAVSASPTSFFPVVPDAISADGSRTYFSSDTNVVRADADRVVFSDVYERAGGRTTLLNESGGTLINKCGSTLGGTTFDDGSSTTRNAVSSDGRQVVFTVPYGQFDFSDPDCWMVPARIWMKSETEGLVEVSASEMAVPDPPQYASYAGAAADGSRIMFFSPARLVDGAASGGLYVYETAAPRGRRLSLLVPTPDAFVVKTSDDGSTIYFTSTTQLAPGGRAGVTALYVYREANGGTLRWIADDLANDFGNIAGGFEPFRRARISRDGTVLSFTSRGSLTGFDNLNGRTGAPAAEVFVYDDRIGLRCASCDTAGQRPAYSPVLGDASVGTGNLNEVNPNSISDDGRHVFFMSPDRLVAEDENSRVDVYEYSDGRVQLISLGRSNSDSVLADIDAAGNTVMFSTADSLVTQDIDGGDLDMYVARVGGGFAPVPKAPVRPTCNEDGCQGTASPAPGDETPGSATLSEDEHLTPAPPARQRLKVLVPNRATLRALARTGRAKINVRASGAGNVQVRLTARLGGRTRTIASGRARARAGTSTLRVTVKLSRSARRALANRRRFPVRVSARYSGQSRWQSVSIVLRSPASPVRGGRR